MGLEPPRGDTLPNVKVSLAGRAVPFERSPRDEPLWGGESHLPTGEVCRSAAEVALERATDGSTDLAPLGELAVCALFGAELVHGQDFNLERVPLCRFPDQSLIML